MLRLVTLKVSEWLCQRSKTKVGHIDIKFFFLFKRICHRFCQAATFEPENERTPPYVVPLASLRYRRFLFSSSFFPSAKTLFISMEIFLIFINESFIFSFFLCFIESWVRYSFIIRFQTGQILSIIKKSHSTGANNLLLFHKFGRYLIYNLLAFILQANFRISSESWGFLNQIKKCLSAGLRIW